MPRRSDVAVAQRFLASTRLERHRHGIGYAAVVVAGGYVEAGDSGRFRLGAGAVVFHRAFEAHADQFGAAGAEVLNLPLPIDAPDVPVAVLRDLDAVVRTAERDRLAASSLLSASCVAATDGPEDWQDLLAAALREDPSLRLTQWAEAAGLTLEAVARGFKRAYGVSPKRYRADARAPCMADDPRLVAAAGAARPESRLRRPGSHDSRRGRADGPDAGVAAAHAEAGGSIGFKNARPRTTIRGGMNRRDCLFALGRLPLVAAVGCATRGSLVPAAPAPRTRWNVTASEALDALCFLGPLSGDPFYTDHYREELAQFLPGFSAEAVGIVQQLKASAKEHGDLLGPFLCLVFSAGPGDTLADLRGSLAEAEQQLLLATAPAPTGTTRRGPGSSPHGRR
ncbi:hypothetical protein OV079_28725 [Nannocystis pusilla]|uniref:HTH araC/xylS-type domain-containing protein n=1 Tax=Nannocystis pusilla TaxID=889268 RepID=A0A9X3J0A8_9BACT|nr:hypothetical protein [Nannocystis pusilla]MCY1009479.1 hypothetical protein [Nannocystis pusilla]